MEQTKGIGSCCGNLREKEGVRQTQLCKGLCSHAKYVRIEYDQQEMDFFLIDRLMGRLGKSVERLTYVLPIEVYEIYELRQEIQQNICLGKWEEAEQCLEEYQKNRKAEEPLHQQFIEQEYAQIAWLQRRIGGDSLRTSGKSNCADNAGSGNAEKDGDFKCRRIQVAALSLGSLFWYGT